MSAIDYKLALRNSCIDSSNSAEDALSNWLKIDKKSARQVLIMYWLLRFSNRETPGLIQRAMTRRNQTGSPLDDVKLRKIIDRTASPETQAVLEQHSKHTRNKRSALTHLANAWGYANVVITENLESTGSADDISLLAASQFSFGQGTAYLAVARRATIVASKKASSRADKHKRKISELEQQLPALMETYVVNQAYKSAEKIMQQLESKEPRKIGKKAYKNLIAKAKRNIR